MVAAGADLPSAMRVANHAAGIVVGKLGTASSTARSSLAEPRDAILIRTTAMAHHRHRRRRIHRLQPREGAQRARRARHRRRRQPRRAPTRSRNLVDCEIADYLDKEDFLAALARGEFDGEIDAVLHQGACSDTMETDGRYMMENNYRYSLRAARLLPATSEIPFIYASSASVYGAGRVVPRGARARGAAQRLRLLEVPVRPGRAPAARATRDRAGRRASATSTSTARARRTRGAWPRSPSTSSTSTAPRARVRLFEGSDGYGAGEQCRDFVSVEDVVRVNLFFLDHPRGLGHLQRRHRAGRRASTTSRRDRQRGAARSRGEAPLSLARAARAGRDRVHPVSRRAARASTRATPQADIGALRAAGYDAPFLTVRRASGATSTRCCATLAGGSRDDAMDTDPRGLRRQHAARAPAAHARRAPTNATCPRQAGGQQSGRLGQGPAGAVDDRARRAARRDQAGRHADRGDQRQHRHRARDGRGDARLPHGAGDARAPVDRAAPDDGRLRRRSSC